MLQVKNHIYSVKREQNRRRIEDYVGGTQKLNRDRPAPSFNRTAEGPSAPSAPWARFAGFRKAAAAAPSMGSFRRISERRRSGPRYMGLNARKKGTPASAPKNVIPDKRREPRRSGTHGEGGTMDPGARLRRGRDDDGPPLHGLVSPDSEKPLMPLRSMGSFRREKERTHMQRPNLIPDPWHLIPDTPVHGLVSPERAKSLSPPRSIGSFRRKEGLYRIAAPEPDIRSLASVI